MAGATVPFWAMKGPARPDSGQLCARRTGTAAAVFTECTKRGDAAGKTTTVVMVLSSLVRNPFPPSSESARTQSLGTTGNGRDSRHGHGALDLL
jgi:hypothetical protein